MYGSSRHQAYNPRAAQEGEAGTVPANARLLAVVRELALELQPRKGARLEVTLDSDLDRDLALDSLGRAELLQRLDRAFHVRLPERLISEAATPRDLLAGVLGARPDAVDFETARTPAAALPEIGAPTHASTLLEVLRAHVRAHPARPHIRLWARDGDERYLTYGDLDRDAARAAAGLLELDLPLQHVKEHAKAYLRLGLDCLAPPPPRLVAIGGLSGTGKTTLAAAVAPMLGPAPGALHLRSDLERKLLFGVEETMRLGATSYTGDIGQRVYAALRRKARIALEAGHAVVIDAVSSRPDERNALESLAAELSVPFHGLWLEADADKLIARVAARRNDASDATAEVVRQQLGFAVGPFSAAWTRIDANASAEEARDRAMLILIPGSGRLA